eukprot:scaffold152336_cov22-Tisochrysis_lutea.AAC.1
MGVSGGSAWVGKHMEHSETLFGWVGNHLKHTEAWSEKVGLMAGHTCGRAVSMLTHGRYRIQPLLTLHGIFMGCAASKYYLGAGMASLPLPLHCLTASACH